MGEEFKSRDPVRMRGIIKGTDTIRQIDVIKDSDIAHTLQTNQSEVEFEFEDQKTKPGESYYYLRVIQKDGEMAWGSPAWVTYFK